MAASEPLSGLVSGPGIRPTSDCLLMSFRALLGLSNWALRSGESLAGLCPAGPSGVEGVLLKGVVGRSDDEKLGVLGTTGSDVVACIGGFF